MFSGTLGRIAQRKTSQVVSALMHQSALNMTRGALVTFSWRPDVVSGGGGDGVSPPSAVQIAGTFTSWQPVDMVAPPAQQETAPPTVGYWTLDRHLEPGEHQYKYVVDGQWIHDEKKDTVENDQGSKNNVIRIEDYPGTEPAVMAAVTATAVGTAVAACNDQANLDNPIEVDQTPNDNPSQKVSEQSELESTDTTLVTPDPTTEIPKTEELSTSPPVNPSSVPDLDTKDLDCPSNLPAENPLTKDAPQTQNVSDDPEGTVQSNVQETKPNQIESSDLESNPMPTPGNLEATSLEEMSKESSNITDGHNPLSPDAESNEPEFTESCDPKTDPKPSADALKEDPEATSIESDKACSDPESIGKEDQDGSMTTMTSLAADDSVCIVYDSSMKEASENVANEAESPGQSSPQEKSPEQTESLTSDLKTCPASSTDALKEDPEATSIESENQSSVPESSPVQSKEPAKKPNQKESSEPKTCPEPTPEPTLNVKKDTAIKDTETKDTLEKEGSPKEPKAPAKKDNWCCIS